MGFLNLLKHIPLIRDVNAYYLEFGRKVGNFCRGVYPSYEAAVEAVPKSGASGYGQPAVSNHSDPSMLTVGLSIGEFNKRDYPLLVWLARAFETESTVFDLGGNVGLGYYSYQNFIRYPQSIDWTVCELPEFCQQGEKIAKERGVQNIHFTSDQRRAELSAIFITSGTLQYLPKPLPDMLRELTVKPRHLLIHRVPLYDGPSFYSVQYIGYAFCAYHIQNKHELFESLKKLGYKLIDSWSDSRICFIPFHPDRKVNGYSGAYFQYDPP
jgi:putative methyltransferase (TIGR04325 family)